MRKSTARTAIHGHGASTRRPRTLFVVAAVAAAALSGSFAGMERLRADEPAQAQEGLLEPFLGPPRLDVQPLFDGGRFPSVVVARDGTVLAFWGRDTLPRLRRSEDGGATWGPEIEVGDNPEHAGRGLGAAVVDETSGDVMVFMDGTEGDWEQGHAWRSRDHGKTWVHEGEKTTLVQPNTPPAIEGNDFIPGRGSTHGGDSGITLRHGEHRGRLLVPARVMPGGNARQHWPKHYNCAIYSDDGGQTWQTSGPFPAFGTGEGALAELSDGRIYYDSRRHLSTDGLNPRRRHIAHSDDGGRTWKDLSVSDVLPDGDQNRDYGLMAGLVRLPVEGHDLLVFSNIVSSGGRHNGHVWASFDGGRTWPRKRVVDEGSFAYSSMTAGRPGTVSDGWIYLLYEGSGGGRIARLNLAWLLKGEPTGDGEAPEWE